MSARRSTGLFLSLLLLSALLARPVRAAESAEDALFGTNAVWSVPATGDLLQFADGSSLHGHLQGISTSSGVSWKHPDSKELIDFAPTNLAWVRFEQPKPAPVHEKPSCRLRFANGDEIYGELLSLNAQELEFQTWFGASLKCRRDALRSIAFLSKGYSVLYEGPTSSEGWVQGRSPRGWEYRDGAFVANGAGTLGRDLKLTDSCSVGFDLAWNGHFSLIVALYTTVLDRFDYSSSSYMFYLSPGYVTLQRVQGGAGATTLGQTQIPEMGRKNKLHLEIRANKQDSTLALFIDDHMVQRWKDAAGFLGQGSGIVFFAQLDGPSIKLSNMKVAQWEGDLSLDTSTNAPPKGDVVYLVNHDKVTGQIGALDNGMLAVTAEQTPLKIPLARVSQIHLNSPSFPQAVSGPGELRAFFAGGGTVSFKLKEWSASRVSGTSDNFGQLSFEPQFVRQLQFNPGQARSGPESLEVLDQDIWELE